MPITFMAFTRTQRLEPVEDLPVAMQQTRTTSSLADDPNVTVLLNMPCAFAAAKVLGALGEYRGNILRWIGPSLLLRAAEGCDR